MMSTTAFISVVVGVIIASGLLGGVLNYYLTRKADPDDTYVGKSLLLGVGAALLVPLFLHTISSQLLQNIQEKKDPEAILVFAGFCLVAAISSTAFIKTISDKVLREAREAKKAAEDAKKTATGVESDAREAKQAAEDANKRASGLESAVEPIIAKETDLASDEQPTSLAMQTLPSLSENEEKVLRELCVGKALRTRTSVARKAKMLKPEVDKLVDSLKERGLVDYKMIPKADGGEMRRWFVTPAGRELVARLSPDTEVQG